MTIHPQRAVYSQILAPDRAAATAARTSSNLDTRGHAYATIHVSLSSGANTNAGTVTLSVQHSDDTVATNFATVTANETVAVTAANSKPYLVNLLGKKRYLRLVATPSTTTNDTVTVGALAALSRTADGPGSVGDMSGGADATIVV